MAYTVESSCRCSEIAALKEVNALREELAAMKKLYDEDTATIMARCKHERDTCLNYIHEWAITEDMLRAESTMRTAWKQEATKVPELEAALKACEQNHRIMTDVRQLVPAEDARMVQAVLIAVDRAEKAESLLAKCREALDMIATLTQNDEDPRICKIALAGLGAFPATHEVAPKAQEVE
jgi:hypothetical protein